MSVVEFYDRPVDVEHQLPDAGSSPTTTTSGPTDANGNPLPDGRCHGAVFDRASRTYRRCNTLFRRPGSVQLYCKRHTPKPRPLELPDSVKSALAEVLGQNAGQIEQEWLSLLASKNERVRLDALKALTQATTTLASRGAPGSRGSAAWPQTHGEVQALTLNELRALMLGYYYDSLHDSLERASTDEEAIQDFLSKHGRNQVEIALLLRAVQTLPRTLAA